MEAQVAVTVSCDGLRELAGFRAEKGCAVSVYLDLHPSVAPTAGDAASRVNSLIHDGEMQAEAAQELTHEQREALRNDLARIRDFFTRDRRVRGRSRQRLANAAARRPG